MLTRLDRLLLAVRDRAAAADTFRQTLDARQVREDRSDLLAARRAVLQAGTSELELLEPADGGPLAEHLERWGEGIFAVGFAVGDLPALSRRLSERGIAWREEGGRIQIEPDQTPGMRIVLSPEADRQPVGLVRWLYEVTNIVDNHRQAAAFYAETFGLDPSRFQPISSEQYGYTGALLLFDPPRRLDRIELAQITDPSRPMGRFAARRGQCIYMAFMEADDVTPVVRRLEERGARYVGGPDPNEEALFIHPSGLHGVLLGVSRTNLAWRWSGRPELAGRS